jgi:glycosyltransferase involved in cell wall biosynthesis
MEKRPIVSVLMTAYQRERYIEDAIKSVLASSLQDFELVVVDDGSTDNTVGIAQSLADTDERVKVYVNEKNLGDYPNRNKAASVASGKYIKYLDSDDIMYPHCLQVMVHCMESFPEAGYGLSAIGDEKRPYPVSLSPREAYLEHFSDFEHFNRAPGSSIIKKEAFDKLGGFSGVRQVGDFEFWLKIGCYYPLVKMPVDLYWSRLHENTESNVHDGNEKLQLKFQVLKNVFLTEKVPLTDLEKKKVLDSFNNSIYNRIIRKLTKN